MTTPKPFRPGDTALVFDERVEIETIDQDIAAVKWPGGGRGAVRVCDLRPITAPIPPTPEIPQPSTVQRIAEFGLIQLAGRMLFVVLGLVGAIVAVWLGRWGR